AATATKEKKPTHHEEIKTAIPTLAGHIAATLADPAADRFSEDDVQFMKFHGIYQQDDRDLRKTGKKFIFMIRGRIPGGVLQPRGSPWRCCRSWRRITRFGSKACSSTSRIRRTRTSWTRSTARRICRGNSRRPSRSRRSMTWTFSRTASATSPSRKAEKSSAT